MAKRNTRRRAWPFGKRRGGESSYDRYYQYPNMTRKKRHGLFSQFSHLSSDAKRGVFSIALLTVGVILLLSLFDLAGGAGRFLIVYTTVLFGFGKFYVPLLFIFIAFFLMTPAKNSFFRVIILGAALFILSLNGFVHSVKYSKTAFEAAQDGLGGGFLGLAISYPVVKILGPLAASIFLFSLMIISIFLFFNTSFGNMIAKIRELFLSLLKGKIKKEEASASIPAGEVEVEFTNKGIPLDYDEDEKNKENKEEKGDTTSEEMPEGVAKRKYGKIDIPVDLLDAHAHRAKSGDISAHQEIIQKTLQNFHIPVEMGEVNVGPTFTQYTIKPSEGIKLSRIVGLSDNLALALAAHPIRVEAPIPGKSLVGIEVPNKSSALVSLRSMIESPEFTSRKSNLSVSIGKDVKGTPVFGDMSRMPHLLIAGSTNSGKSVCINSMIVSLFYENSPDELKFIFVDPKRVELTIYNDIPYLLTPVITDVKRTMSALKWTIAEMERRLDLLSRSHKRNIHAYNEGNEEKLPYIVFIIDELADLMAMAASEIEGLIIRLAQMARAVGIHLVLATQRPSVDVITGLIKANITTRIAFSVASAVDSRTILDGSGAEKLLGRGDMLYISPEFSKPKRLQGAFASDQEIKRLIEFVKDHMGKAEYVQEITEHLHDGSGFSPDTFFHEGDSDSLLPEAKNVIVQAGKASASLLQRRLKIGYARAARILDLLEAGGFIGPGDGARPREILVQHNSFEMNKNSDDEVESDEKEGYNT